MTKDLFIKLTLNIKCYNNNTHITWYDQVVFSLSNNEEHLIWCRSLCKKEKKNHIFH